MPGLAHGTEIEILSQNLGELVGYGENSRQNKFSASEDFTQGNTFGLIFRSKDTEVTDFPEASR